MNDRYIKQIKLPQIGIHGQNRLARARILCVGAGGLGSPILLYLSAAGIGYLDVIDSDRVDLSNLQRQILFQEKHQGLLKAEIAVHQIKQLNSSIHSQAICGYLGSDNIEKIIQDYDLIIDGSDNFKTKLLINDACYRLGIPWAYAGVSQFEGQTALFKNQGQACYRCLFPNPDQVQVKSCEQAGVLGSVVGILGSCQATLALQHILGLCEEDARLHLFDFSGFWHSSHIQIQKRPGCLTCSQNPQNITFETDFCYLDVRTLEEWELGHRENAIHWPLDRIERGEFPTLPEGKKTWIAYCQSGMRAAKATQLLDCHLGIKR